MRADFVNEVSKILKIKRKDLIEKDLILHQILCDLSDDRFFAANFLFKGGTCLIKAYFGYLRFSEDIDFTWKDQSVFNGMSQKSIRAYYPRLSTRLVKSSNRLPKKEAWISNVKKAMPITLSSAGATRLARLRSGTVPRY